MSERKAGRGGRAGRAVVLIAALAIVAVAGCRGDTTPPSAPGLVPATAADIIREVGRSRGSVVLVDLWATWCEPCREELPDLLRLEKRFGPRGFRLILVSADFTSQRPQAAAFLASRGVRFPTYAKNEGDQAFIDGLDPRWTGALPACLLYDREGRKAAFWEGKLSYQDLVGRVEPLLDRH